MRMRNVSSRNPGEPDLRPRLLMGSWRSSGWLSAGSRSRIFLRLWMGIARLVTPMPIHRPEFVERDQFGMGIDHDKIDAAGKMTAGR